MNLIMVKSFTLFGLSVILSVHAMNHSQVIEGVDLNICPYTDFCHRKAIQILEHNKGVMSCCAACSCTETCWKVGNCCPDKEPVTFVASEFTCTSTKVKTTPADRTVYDGYRYGIPRYRIVSSCPVKEKNKTLIDKCAGKNKSSIEDYTWVTDQQSGRIFQNKHCARCHGVNTFFKWQIRTTFSIVLILNFSSLPHSIHSPQCELMVELPENMTQLAENYRCYEADIGECNKTGLWRHYDANMKTACEIYDSPIIHYKISSFVDLYKNIFCYYCNGGKGLTTNDICTDLITGKTGSSESFSALVDFTGQRQKIATSECEMHEIYDMFTHRCRQLLCPFGSSGSYGTCASLVLETQGLKIGINYNLHLEWEQPQQSFNLSIEENLVDTIRASFRKVFGLNKKTCPPCRVEIRLVDSNVRYLPAELVISVTMPTNSKCQLESILNKATAVLGKQMEIAVNDSVLVSFVNLEKRSRGVIKSMRVLYRRVTGFGICYPVYELDKEKICPEIEVKYSDLKLKSSGGNRNISSLLPVGNQSDNATVTVCWEDYAAFMSDSNFALALFYNYETPMITLSAVLLLIQIVLRIVTRQED